MTPPFSLHFSFRVFVLLFSELVCLLRSPRGEQHSGSQGKSPIHLLREILGYFSGPAHLPLNTQGTLLTGSQPQRLQWKAGVATLTSVMPGLLGFLVCLG